MSYSIDTAANRVPVFGVDLTLNVASTDYSAKWIVTGFDYQNGSEKVSVKNGDGDDVIRVWHNIGPGATLSVDVFIVGTDAAGAITNNVNCNPGVAVTVSSTRYAYLNGSTWKVDDFSTTGSNTGVATAKVSLVKALS